MTKQHFIALADHIRACNALAAQADDPATFGTQAIRDLADFCQAQNPLFKRDRWLAYIAGECGKNGGKVK
jgi:hypothetical protein